MDDRAFEEAIVCQHAGLVRRLTLVLHDTEEALDIAQDAIEHALRARERFDGADARAWLHTIGLRLAFNRRRSIRRRSAALLRLGGGADGRPGARVAIGGCGRIVGSIRARRQRHAHEAPNLRETDSNGLIAITGGSIVRSTPAP